MVDTPKAVPPKANTFTDVSKDVAEKFPTGANPGETRAQQRERLAKTPR